MKNSILFNGTVDKVSTMADGTLRVYVGTQELSYEKMAQLFSFDKSAGYFLISKQEISKEEIRTIEEASEGVTPDKGKSPSKRLRSVLYHVWNTTLAVGKRVGFENFYKEELDKITEHYIKKLDANK